MDEIVNTTKLRYDSYHRNANSGNCRVEAQLHLHHELLEQRNIS